MLKTILTVSSMFRVFRSFILYVELDENKLTKISKNNIQHNDTKIYFKKQDAFPL